MDQREILMDLLKGTKDYSHKLVREKGVVPEDRLKQHEEYLETFIKILPDTHVEGVFRTLGLSMRETIVKSHIDHFKKAAGKKILEEATEGSAH